MKMLPCLLAIGSLCGALLTAAAADTTNSPSAIGVYDSRAVAYAHFLSPSAQKELREKISAAKAAKQSGDQAKADELAAQLKAQQEQNHRQVFSTAPVNDALEAIKDRLAAIQKEAGVSALVSKWDEATLDKYKTATRVDVTDQLVRAFIQPDEKQAQMILSIEKSKPLPLEKCDELIRDGKI